MALTAQQLAIAGSENIREINGEVMLTPAGVHRLVDAVISGRIQGDVQAARNLKESINATVQARKGLN